MRVRSIGGAILGAVLWLAAGAEGVEGMDGAPSAEGMVVEPGMWEITSEARLPMMPEPRTSTRNECIAVSALNPEDFMREAQATCEITDSKATSTEMSWRLLCTTPMGSAAGRGDVKSAGSTFDGKLLMTVKRHGREFVLQTKWKGRRTGPCT